MTPDEARGEVNRIANGIISRRVGDIPPYLAEQIVESLADDVLGYGPLEELLVRDEITDIMVNGPRNVFIEVGGRVKKTDVRFKNRDHLLNVCQRIVSQVGRRVDESSPIADARLPDGSRVNIIIHPLSLDGPTLTIRKFRKQRLTLDDLVMFGSLTPDVADILRVIARTRCNVIVSGGTGSGKTTLLNCLTAYIDEEERIVTCEDAAELQLQQPHTVRLETRPPNLEGEGEVRMQDLVKNCLRMRPDRIIVGEVRGGEAFDLMQAMNTGHDGSMGSIHSNSPRDTIRRLETMITSSSFQLPTRSIREMISSSVEIIVHMNRLRDGRRVVTHITEVVGMEEDVIQTQDLVRFEMTGEGADGRIIGKHCGTGVVVPNFLSRAIYYNEDARLKNALSEVNRQQSILRT
ncbi:CpaF family protein [Ponticoccus sp. SC2-23]|nr:CpaF family protein [Ponticoccus sp. SC6-9]MBM1227477.1 CpaF family protein [Ponticoccus sp. SC6-15]MBM1231993.1 CpaF family protein [Ponticoccus sp. SC6-38]MBM1236496.1 CpaF family protein [Ponticoccus sp. SC6-45]MBM1241012.1 CpaF family protein [Ponticoccus sp. SC6-49]MBM1245517.1 CpaF family protein [Ponticoccus sp. SC2-64]MBM1245550.1 CpaF family protein [Ponticoccus sp. SC6-42]MBM1254512.1 CpaF family protein [Ponticoccus sp. SC6-33]MBM1259020.1 CpaF family protein [Ponticoccus sp. 